MGQAAYAKLTANGTDITGENVAQTVGGEDVHQQIEILEFDHTVHNQIDVNTAQKSGHTRHGTIKLRTKLGKETPQMYQALVNNEIIEGVVTMFRHNPDTGETEVHFTIEITSGRVVSVGIDTYDTQDPGTASRLDTCLYELTYNTITWTYVPSGVVAFASWTART